MLRWDEKENQSLGKAWRKDWGKKKRDKWKLGERAVKVEDALKGKKDSRRSTILK